MGVLFLAFERTLFWRLGVRLLSVVDLTLSWRLCVLLLAFLVFLSASHFMVLVWAVLLEGGLVWLVVWVLVSFLRVGTGWSGYLGWLWLLLDRVGLGESWCWHRVSSGCSSKLAVIIDNIDIDTQRNFAKPW